jgi:hypothetical protein
MTKGDKRQLTATVVLDLIDQADDDRHGTSYLDQARPQVPVQLAASLLGSVIDGPGRAGEIGGYAIVGIKAVGEWLDEPQP